MILNMLQSTIQLQLSSVCRTKYIKPEFVDISHSLIMIETKIEKCHLIFFSEVTNSFLAMFLS